MKFFCPALCMSLAALAVAAEPLPDVSPEQLADRLAFAQYSQAAGARDLAQKMSLQLHAATQTWMGNVDDFMATIPASEDLPLPPEPEESKDTIIDSTRGMYIDAVDSTLCYMGQVRLRDPRLRLDCEQLYLQLERKKVGDKKSELTQSAQDLTAVDLSGKETPEKRVLDTPLVMKAQQVLMDLDSKCLYARGEQISLKHERGFLEVTGASPYVLIADTDGFIYVQGDEIKGYSQDAKGQLSEFSCEGSALFLLDGDSLVLQKNVHVKAQQTEIRSQGSLRMMMKPSSPGEPLDAQSLRLSRQYEGLAYVTAEDTVQITGKNKKGETYQLDGDLLSYDAQRGEFMMTGERSTLCFADQSMLLSGGALSHLYEDGSLKMKAETISGHYQRPCNQGEGTLKGEFLSHQELYMRTGENTLHFPHGLSFKDPEIDFSSTQAVAIHFIAQDAEPEQESDFATMPQLDLARMKDVKAIDARGDVCMQGSGSQDYYLKGNDVHFDLQQGLVRLAAEPNQTAQLRYQKSSFEVSSPDSLSLLELLPSGDISAKGANIEATMDALEGQGTSKMKTASSLYLHRLTGQLVLERDVFLQSKDAEFTCDGELLVQLRLSDEETRSESKDRQRYPHLAYHFAGLESALAQGGATLRTAQFSMQCDGMLKVEMSEQQKNVPVSSDLNMLRYAEANDRVRFVAKDAENQYYRATGDQLKLDGESGVKLLTGRTVSVATKDMVHEASGAGAQIRVDAKNAVNIRGEKQQSYAQNLQERFGLSEEQKKSSPKQ